MNGREIDGILKLERPLIVFDLEATGVDPENDRIVEIACIRINIDGSILEKSRRINPTIPIPPGATEVHGISYEDIKDKPTFSALSAGMFRFFEGCDLGGYNVRGYDIPLLTNEFGRVGVKWPDEDIKVIDVYSIVRRLEPRDLTWALSYYCGERLENAHSASADTDATLKVLLGQMDKYGVQSLAEMDPLQRDPDWLDDEGELKLVSGEAVVSFGKHKGKSVKVLPYDYIEWMEKQDFSNKLISLIKEYRSR